MHQFILRSSQFRKVQNENPLLLHSINIIASDKYSTHPLFFNFLNLNIFIMKAICDLLLLNNLPY